MKQPLMVAYGIGRNSTAMLIGMRDEGITPDLILFSDTAAEKPETYDYLPIMQRWCRDNGFPEIVTVKYVAPRAAYQTLEEEVLHLGILPSVCYGGRSCSIKYKQVPQEKYVAKWPTAIECWEAGGKVRKAVGFDSGEEQRWKRAVTAAKDSGDGDRYENWYPLMEWGWSLEDCIERIEREGLPVPVKSACFF